MKRRPQIPYLIILDSLKEKVEVNRFASIMEYLEANKYLTRSPLIINSDSIKVKDFKKLISDLYHNNIKV